MDTAPHDEFLRRLITDRVLLANPDYAGVDVKVGRSHIYDASFGNREGYIGLWPAQITGTDQDAQSWKSEVTVLATLSSRLEDLYQIQRVWYIDKVPGEGIWTKLYTPTTPETPKEEDDDAERPTTEEEPESEKLGGGESSPRDDDPPVPEKASG